MASPLLEAAGIRLPSQRIQDNMSMGPPSTRKDVSIMQQQWRGVQQAQANERYDAAGAQMAQDARDAATQRQNRAATRPLYGNETPAQTHGQQAIAQYDAANPAQALPTSPDVPRSDTNPTDARLAAGTQTSPGAPTAMPTPTPAPTPAAAPSLQPTTTNNVVREGNSYSGANVAGDIAVHGKPAGGGIMEVAGLRGYGSPSPATSAGGSPLLAAAGIEVPTIRHSGNDWQARKDLENAATSASSIMNRPAWQGAGMGRFGGGGQAATPPAVAAYQAQLQTDQALRQSQPGLMQIAMRENAANTREGVQQQGLNQRSIMQTLQNQQRIDMDRETQGYANRSAGQMEGLRGVLSNPGATPEQRHQATQTILALQGKQPQNEWGVQVTPTTKNIDGSTSMGSIVRYNKATGQAEVVQQPGQGGQSPSENHTAWLKQNPSQAANFDQIYGAGAAKRVLGQG